MPHSIKIRGIAPAGLASRTEAERLQFWTLAASAALKVKDRELAQGLDAHGDPLKPIAPITRRYRKSAMTSDGRGDPSAPPLMPARQKSRVRSLLAARAFSTHAELYWRYDPFTGASFDEVLNYQRAMGRDVFGISPDGLAAVRKEAHRLWAAYLKGKPSIEATGRALPAAALAAGPQARIARIVAASAEPNAGTAARQLAGVGNLNTRNITRGIGAPVVKAMKASATRTGGLPSADWRKFWTAEIPSAGSGGTMAGTAPRPRAPRPSVAAMRPRKRPTPEIRVVFPDGPEAEALDVASAIVGRAVRREDFAGLVGAQSGMKVSVVVGSESNIGINVEGPEYRSFRELRVLSTDETILENFSSETARDARGRGIGRRVFRDQVRTARRLGISRIVALAARDSTPSNPLIGYKVWPKFGFDAPLPQMIIDLLPGPLKPARRLSDLYRSEAGILWWEEHGIPLKLTFDLTPGSVSLRMWRDYLASKGEKP